MAMFKVWNKKQTLKKSIIAKDLNGLRQKGCQKLSIQQKQLSSIVLENDGTEIDCDEVLMHVKNQVLIFLEHGESWTRMGDFVLPAENPGMAGQNSTGDNGEEELVDISLEERKQSLDKEESSSDEETISSDKEESSSDEERNSCDKKESSSDEEEGFTDEEESSSDEPEIRLILLGKTGSGKSATGNSILKDKVFNTIPSATSVTRKTDYEVRTVGQQRIRIVDTPGLFDNSTRTSELMLKKEILKCIAMSSPGPHVFLYVIRIGVLTIQENETAMQILDLFGDEIKNFVIVVFTGLDQLNGKEGFSDYCKTLPPSLKKQFKAFGNRIVPINNISGTESDTDEFVAYVVDIVHKNKWKQFSNPLIEQVSIAFFTRVREVKRTKKCSYKEAIQFVLNEVKNEGKVFQLWLAGAVGASIGGLIVAVAMSPIGQAVFATIATATTGFACSLS